MTKRKGRFDGQSHFVSPLSLTMCASKLHALNDNDLLIEIEEISSDKMTFSAKLLERGVLRAEGKGALLRWEGTLTRVECQVTIREGIIEWSLLVLAMSALGLLIIPFVIFSAAGIDPTLWILMAGTGIAVVLFMMHLANRFAPADDVPENLLAIIESTLESPIP